MSPLPGILLFLFLVGVAVLSVLLIRPPALLPADARPDQYSAERAFSHVEALAARPHPVGTAAHTQVEAYLIAQLGQMGLDPQVQKAFAVREQWVGRVENVLARLPGSRGGGKAVLLSAHYDSTPTGPGAGDDASGVATLLETARALKAAKRPLANDVIFLFSDAEEVGALGASAFVHQHPWAKTVGVVINLDTGGMIGGPNLLVNDCPDNGWLITQFAQVVPGALANSLIPEIYRRSGSGDDFTTVFRPAGYPGFEIGCRGGAFYHITLDDPEHLSRDSLQHQGYYAVSLARRFGDLDLTVAHHGSAVYFNLLGNRLLVHYPRAWAVPLVALSALAWGGALAFGLRRKQVTLRGVLLGALGSLFVVGVLVGVNQVSSRLLLALYPQYAVGMYNDLYYSLAFVALGVALGALLHRAFRTRIRTAELASGALLLWLASAVGFPLWMPGASWVFTWPLLFAALGLWAWLALRGSALRRATAWGTLCLAVCAIPALTLLGPSLVQRYESVPIDLALGLLVGLLAPHLAIIARPRAPWLPILMGTIAACLLLIGHLASTPTPARPLQDGVVYALSADEGRASWFTWGDLDPWTKQFFEDTGGGGDVRAIWAWAATWPPVAHEASAPLTDVRAPTIDRLGAAAPGTFRLRVVPAPATWVVWLNAMPYPTPVTYYVDDRPIKAEEGGLAYWAPPAEGFDLTVKGAGLGSLKLRVLAHILGLPSTSAFTYTARPAWIIPSPDAGDNSTYVAKTFSFGTE